MLESAGVPLPGETILVSAAAFAGNKHSLDIRYVIAAAAGGAIVGDNIGFWVGREFGTPLLSRWGYLIGLDERKRKLGQYLFTRHGGKIVFFGRFVALLRRVAFTLGALLVYRLGTFIPLPGIDPAVWEQIFRGQSGGLLEMASLFSGGAVSRMAIFALNLIPYLTAAILVQVALLFSSRFGALNDRGDRGRQIVRRWTLVLTLFFAAFQSYGMAVGLEGFDQMVAEPGFSFRLSTVITLTGGT